MASNVGELPTPWGGQGWAGCSIAVFTARSNCTMIFLASVIALSSRLPRDRELELLRHEKGRGSNAQGTSRAKRPPHTPVNRSDRATPRPFAIQVRDARVGFVAPRSMTARCLASKSERSPSCSWVSPFSFLSELIFRPSRAATARIPGASRALDRQLRLDLAPTASRVGRSVSSHHLTSRHTRGPEVLLTAARLALRLARVSGEREHRMKAFRISPSIGSRTFEIEREDP